MTTLFTAQINNSHDVARFFMWIVFDAKICFHPDDSFADYGIMSNSLAQKYDDKMNRCFEVCEAEERDIYEIANRVMGLFYYCDKNDALANLA